MQPDARRYSAEVDFEDQVVVVTGASRGIGRGIAEAFAKRGAKVACVATNIERAQSTADNLENAKAYVCDVSQSTEVEKLAADVVADLGTPSVLVNNAGITRDLLTIRMGDDDWDRVLDVNLKGSFLTIRSFVRLMMKARYGRIVNIASIIGQTGAAGQANYAASKAGVVGLTKSIAKEFGSRNITCNAVAPGFIKTDMTSELSAEVHEWVMKTAPIARLGSPEDIANAVLFLASRDAEYITGQLLTVDGGLTL